MPRQLVATRSSRSPKIPKACEECRRRKQKCDGQAPCRICTKRHIDCYYRKASSHQRARVSSLRDRKVTPQPMPSQAQPLRVHIFNNIRATHNASRTELFYGASSNFSLLQHLDIHLPTQSSPASQSRINTDEVQDGAESIERYNYESLVFDNLSLPKQNTTANTLVGHDSAKAFLRNFLLTTAHRMPFLESARLCKALETLYSPTVNDELQPCEKSIILIALAIGAIPSFDDASRQLLIEQARAETQTTMYDISLKAVQIALLGAQCEFDAGNSNACYLQLGCAIRKAFATGAHRAGSLEAKHTMWALFCSESLICLKLGRPSGLTECDIVAPTLEDPSYMDAFVRLCIVVRSASDIYCSVDNSMAKDLDIAYSIQEKLSRIDDKLRTDLGIEIGGEMYALMGEKLAWHIALSYLYHFTSLIVHRPFFLLCSELKRRSVYESRDARVASQETADLTEASLVCVRSARSIVLLSESLWALQMGLEGSYNHGFYLESACFVLVLAVVYDRSSPSTDLQCLEKGLGMLQKLGQRKPINSIVSALQQMLAKVHLMRGNTPSNRTYDDVVLNERHLLPSATGLQREPEHSACTYLDDPRSESHAQPFTPDGDRVLEELWSMIDCNVGFPSIFPGL